MTLKIIEVNVQEILTNYEWLTYRDVKSYMRVIMMPVIAIAT